MQKRSLGASGIEVSRIGLGTTKFGRNQGVKYPHAFALPTDQQIKTLLAQARELGINLIDTAPAYGTSEERLGGILRGSRHEWVICSKAGEEFADGVSSYDFTRSALMNSVERSLKRLHTDYLDILLVHSSGDDVRIIDEDHVFDTLAALHAAGKIRAFGMSTKTVAGGLKTLAHADLAMVAYNPSYTDEYPVIAHARLKNKGIFIKKAFASGYLQPEQSLKFILAEPGVTSVIVGTINPVHLQQNVNAVMNN